MRKSVVALLMIASFGVGAVVSVVGLLYSTGNLEPSKDTREAAPTLSLDGPTATPSTLQQVSTQYAEINEKLDVLSTQMAENPVVQVTEVASEPDVPEPTVAEVVMADLPERALYRITEDESEARFYIDEILSDEAIVVVGTTKRVAGDIIVNFSDPAASQLGVVAVNVRTIKTDNEFRDDSIKTLILRSNQEENEFVTFEPTELLSLSSDAVAVGDVVEFQIAGDLTIKGITLNKVFDATVTIVSEERIEGVAQLEIDYAEFDISIKPPPTVSGVGDTVILELDFVALQVEE